MRSTFRGGPRQHETPVTTRLPLPFRTINAAGAALNALGLGRVRLEEGPLLRAATRRTGLADFGDPGFLEGLRALLASAERDADLHLIGRLSLRQIVLDSLVNRLLLAEARERTPGLFARPLVPPIIVTGLPRSGTTFLHRLLAEDPDHHAPRHWELSSPLPPPGRRDARRQKAERFLKARDFLTDDLDNKHFITADTPEEDSFTLGATFEGMYFWMATPVYGYLEWYLAQDHERKYREYRAWLQVLQAAHPGRRLVLKSPEHTGALSTLLRAVPEARLVQTHRDPVAVLASWTSLSRTAQGMTTDALDGERNAAASLHYLAESARRNLAEHDANPGAVFDVRYDDLVADPGGTVRRIYGHYGLAFTEVFQRNLERYVEENPQGKHGAHRYAPGDFGPGEEEVRSRFAAYDERFGFPAGRGASGR